MLNQICLNKYDLKYLPNNKDEFKSHVDKATMGAVDDFLYSLWF